MRYKIGGLLVFLLLTAAALCQAATPDDFAIGGVRLGTNGYEDVVQKLGKPQSDYEDTVGRTEVRILHYRKLGVWVWLSLPDDKVRCIKLDGKDFAGPRGVKVGATQYKITREFGKVAKERIGGAIYNRYTTPELPGQQLLFDMTPGYMDAVILTQLPLEP